MAANPKFAKAMRELVIQWDTQFPVDMAWRLYHQIPFGSPEHLDSDYIKQQFWYEERRLLDQTVKTKEGEDESQNGDDLPPLDLTMYHEIDFSKTTKEEIVDMGLQKEYKKWLAKRSTDPS